MSHAADHGRARPLTRVSRMLVNSVMKARLNALLASGDCVRFVTNFPNSRSGLDLHGRSIQIAEHDSRKPKLCDRHKSNDVTMGPARHPQLQLGKLSVQRDAGQLPVDK
jgi:hypothetical protein